METKKVILKATDGTELILTLPVPYIDYVGNLKIEGKPNLIEEAKKRGYVPGVKIHSVGHSDEIHTITDTIYDVGKDLYFVADESEWTGHFQGQCSNPSIYREGVWAEIIPDKKKLPKTRKEFEMFYYDWCALDREKDNRTFIQYINDCEA